MSTKRDPQAYLQQFHFATQDHTQWNRAFDANVRCEQVDEDLFAARTVSGVLISIVAGGALLGALWTFLAMFYG